MSPRFARDRWEGRTSNRSRSMDATHRGCDRDNNANCWDRRTGRIPHDRDNNAPHKVRLSTSTNLSKERVIAVAMLDICVEMNSAQPSEILATSAGESVTGQFVVSVDLGDRNVVGMSQLNGRRPSGSEPLRMRLRIENPRIMFSTLWAGTCLLSKWEVWRYQ